VLDSISNYGLKFKSWY